MGAEFIGGAVAIRKTREEARAALDALSDDEIATALDGFGDFDEDEITPREFAIDSLSMVYDAHGGGRRDGACWTLDGTEYVVTGGESWGDSPTDLCDAVWAMEALGITA
jgi:hypothetical protein